nr:hypothetical protein [Verrucomicrobiota bacterium]
MMNDSGHVTRDELKRPAVTFIGLFIALFGIVVVRWAVSLFYPGFSLTATIWKESLIWLCVLALVLVIGRGEGLSLRSVNLGTAPVKNSILWGGILVLL